MVREYWLKSFCRLKAILATNLEHSHSKSALCPIDSKLCSSEYTHKGNKQPLNPVRPVSVNVYGLSFCDTRRNTSCNDLDSASSLREYTGGPI